MRRILISIVAFFLCEVVFSQGKDCYFIGSNPQNAERLGAEHIVSSLEGHEYATLAVTIKDVPFFWIEPIDLVLKSQKEDSITMFYFDISHLGRRDSLRLSLKSIGYRDYSINYYPEIYSIYTLSLIPSDTAHCIIDTLIHIDAVDRWVYLGSRCRDSINRDTVVDSIESATVVSKEETVPSKNFIEEAFGLNMEMVYVEGGVFDYGVKRDELKGFDIPLRKDSVIENDFWIGKYEVTIEQWYAVMQDPSVKNAKCPTCPITGISQDAALAFCGKLSEKTESQMAYGLPFEIQWEYAAKGGVHHDTTLFSGSNHLDSVAWYYANSRGEPHDVYDSSKKPNSLGIYGMTGNAAEWCADCDIIDGNVRPYSRGGGYDKDEYRSDVYYYITNRDRKRSEDRFQGFRVMCAPKKGDEENNSNTQPIQTP